MKNPKTLLITLALLFLGFVGGWFYLFDIIQNPTYTPSLESPISTEVDNQSVSVSINFGDGNEVTYTAAALGGNAFELLEAAANENDIELVTESYDFGVFVKSIDGLESSEAMAWIYFVNGESGSVATDQYQLKAGDLIEWKYIKPE
jgi:hypothetical protein